MLIPSGSRDALCVRLRRLRAATIDVERRMLTDRATPAQLATGVLTLREHVDGIAQAAGRLLADD